MADQRSGGGVRTRLQSRPLSPTGVLDENTPQSIANHRNNPRAASNNATRSSIASILSHFRLGCCGAKDHLNPTEMPCQTDAGMAEPNTLGSNNTTPHCPQQKSQDRDTETEYHNQAWLCDRLAIRNTQASPDSPGNGDNAMLAYDVLVPDDESSTEGVHQSAVLVAYTSNRNQPVHMFGIIDTGAALSVLSYPKARLVNHDNLSNVGTRNLYTATGRVTVHGPVWVTFCLRNDGSRTRYRAPFYVLPIDHGESCFDAVLNKHLVQRIGLVEIHLDSAAGEVEALRPGTCRTCGSSSAN